MKPGHTLPFLVLALGALAAHGADMHISWGASAGFGFCDPWNPVFRETNAIAVQLIHSTDTSYDFVLGGGDDVLLAERVLQRDTAASDWADFSAFASYRGPYLAGYVYGLAWGGTSSLASVPHYAGPMQATVEGPLPTTYDFNPNWQESARIESWSGCLSCDVPCTSHVAVAASPSPEAGVLFYGVGGTYRLEISTNLLAGGWASDRFPLNVSSQGVHTVAITNTDPRAMFYRVQKMP
jgi:hypothetical protein